MTPEKIATEIVECCQLDSNVEQLKSYAIHLIEDVVYEEREACAQLCEELGEHMLTSPDPSVRGLIGLHYSKMAEAIRTRGNNAKT